MNHKRGIMFACITAGISGVSVLYNKLFTAGLTDPLTFNILKNGATAIFLTFLLLQTGKLRQLTHCSLRQWKKLFLIGFIGGSIPFILFFAGLAMIPAANAAFLHKTLFLWVALFAVPVLKEKLSPAQVAGFALVAASSLAFGFKGLSWTMGEFFVLGATLLWAVEQIIAKIALQDTDSTVVSWARMSIGSVILLAFLVSRGNVSSLISIPLPGFFAILGSSLLLTGYVLSWYAALKHAPATLVSGVLVIAAPVTTILTALTTMTLPAVTVIVSSTVTVFGICLISLSSHNKTRLHRL